MKKPMIGVLPLYDSEKESYWMLPGYMKGIEDAGGIPIMLPLTTDEEIILRLAESFDGFLFTGGQDINPALYGEEKEELCGELCSERDMMETILFKRVLELDKPAFGICRGLQVFNVLLGGTLYQDIPTQVSQSQIQHKQNPPYTEPIHSVYIREGSMLHKILQIDSMKVNSYHHQGIKTISEQLVPMATADDGLIEAVSMPNKKFVLAVQWHPEFNYKLDDNNFRLFLEFIRACQ
ncbi:gamma-glutamyl-gamma-aminobutyrate hydrolase family protein [Lysinibacillus endophyticus]|uniref:Gamma-glutamyl-gamma-aminobutyrate hydrolase family protein n=1 Tax=Ureibacillus endophyticus TaxID=1978490 RepID=A0A494Z133_9BACL|nr:gamma-glutamyl-gamma-aminobutyrate hydrolase family protein [Lysinibacillus endophyticus]MCP1144397.1 gamma-glutamyl-gamma-aminobutyrate hydrolase family protein [Lysinibacillus endophyticus]RKQ16001.1 gamma-glutamyl-gamma-aminobutyrate hydrolase family protein [Lysinibacillus endophyticus]